jgi:hypothetical protein
LRYSGIVYRTTGPYWGGAYDPTRVSIMPAGVGDFIPQATSRARFEFTIDGITASMQLERTRF